MIPLLSPSYRIFVPIVFPLLSPYYPIIIPLLSHYYPTIPLSYQYPSLIPRSFHISSNDPKQVPLNQCIEWIIVDKNTQFVGSPPKNIPF